MFYSVIIPVFNRPDEIRELLHSLTRQSYTLFEVLIIEDGSTKRCEHVAEQFSQQLTIRYFYKENSGQGFSRNYGFERANGEYFVIFDSDCIIPPYYFETVNDALVNENIDCWGGPDRAHKSFTPMQKAINFSMTSILTTGGIRGGKRRISSFVPRSFNMGISRAVYEKTGGFRITRMAEDLEFSLRIKLGGFKVALIEDAFVYHKRRTNLNQFFRQLHFFGRARINLYRFFPEELKAVHLFPALFTLGLFFSIIFSVAGIRFFQYTLLMYVMYALLLFISALVSEKKLDVALLSVLTSFTQLTAYCTGFLRESWTEVNNESQKKTVG